MRSAIAIFRKDVRHLRVELLVFWLLLAVSAIAGPFTTYWTESYLSADLFAVLASAYLVAAVIHQEALPGDRQYWLTRPIGARQLLAAKLIFIALCVEAPVLLGQITGLALLGIPPQQHLLPIFWHQVYFTTLVFLPFAVIASVTRSLTQLLLGALLIVAGVIVLDLLFRDIFLPSIHATAWLDAEKFAPLVLLAALLLLQYEWRATFAARLTLAALVIVLFFSRSFEVDAPASVTVPVVLGGLIDRSGPAVEIPIRIEGLPPRAEAMIGNVHLIEGGMFRAEVLDYASGSARLIVQLPPSASPRIRGWFNMTLFERAGETRVPGVGERVAVPGIGVCATRQAGVAPPVVLCLAPSVRTALALEFPGELRWVIAPGLDRDVIEYSAPFQPVRRYVGSPYGLDLEKVRSLRSVRTVAFVRGEFDFRVPE